MAARITDDGLWRVTYGDIAGLSKEEYLERQPMRFEKLLPALKPGTYKLTNASPYKLQQRCAPSFRQGRFILVADAAHLCNPFGGMGLTGGFADVGSLYDCLVGMHQGLADDKILDKYSDIRIKLWREMIDPISRANFRRLWCEEAIPERDQFFEMCQNASKDEQLAKDFALVSTSSGKCLTLFVANFCGRRCTGYATTSHSTTTTRGRRPMGQRWMACIEGLALMRFRVSQWTSLKGLCGGCACSWRSLPCLDVSHIALVGT